MTNAQHLIAACTALVVLVFIVGVRMLQVRMGELKSMRIHPQAASNSLQVAAKLQQVQAADNFRNLFETPVLFYALVAVAIGAGHAPGWLVAGVWVYVLLRVVHSAIHCSYNKVMHRFAAFGIGFLLLVVMWFGFAIGFLSKAT